MGIIRIPIEIGAVQFTGSNYDEIYDFVRDKITDEIMVVASELPHITIVTAIPTLSSLIKLKVTKGDWIVRGANEGLWVYTSDEMRNKFGVTTHI